MITVDAYGDDEPQTAFLEVFNQDVRLPVVATVLGMPVEVVGFDYRDERRGVVARCRRDGSRQDLTVVDLVFPPDTVAAWVQAAYRRWLGLDPDPYDMPAGRLAAALAPGPVALATALGRLSSMGCRVE